MLVGLEIHMVISNHKLHCPCKYYAINTQSTTAAVRHSLHTLDYTIHKYRYSIKNCPYELDETLPKVPTPAILKTAANIAKNFNAKLCNPETGYIIQRKLILDGSLISGYQRTGIFAKDGIFKNIRIRQLRLEEDSCKKNTKNQWIVSRQGLPLIELTTEPFEYSENLQKSLSELAQHMREFTNIRGIGTIRQDINIDAGLGKTQIKGVQTLQLVDLLVKKEQLRQVKYRKAITGLRYNIFFKTRNWIVLNYSCTDPAILQTELEAYLNVHAPAHKWRDANNLLVSEKFNHTILSHFFGLHQVGKWPTVRKAEPSGQTAFLRRCQTTDRYVLEPNLPPIKLKEPDLHKKVTKKERLLEMNYELANRLLNKLHKLGFIKFTVIKHILQAFEAGTITKYQIPLIEQKLLAKEKLENILSDPELAPLTEKDLFAILGKSKFREFQGFKHAILSQYRHKIYDIEKIFVLMNSVYHEYLKQGN